MFLWVTTTPFGAPVEPRSMKGEIDINRYIYGWIERIDRDREVVRERAREREKEV